MEMKLGMWYKVLAPRPVVLVTSVNEDGVSNAAPFSFVMPVSMNPPLLAFGSVPKRHTAKNIFKTKDFVVSIPGVDILNKLWKCAESLPEGQSEIEASGLTEIKANNVKAPLIKESVANLECRLFAHHEAGDHIIIIGEVLCAHIKDGLINDGKYAIENADVLMHIGKEEFGLLGKVVKAGQK